MRKMQRGWTGEVDMMACEPDYGRAGEHNGIASSV